MDTSGQRHPIARDFFLYLLVIGTLYVSVGMFISMLFDYVNKLLPDPVDYMPFSAVASSIRMAMATLFIVFPVYVGVTWFLRRDVIAHPEKKDFTVRKWLIYLTLFLAAVTIIVDLVMLVNNFLNGELTLRFALKILVVLIVACAVFSYYFWDLKREVVPGTGPNKWIAIAALVAVFGSIFGGVFVIGSPWQQRLRRLDEQRVKDLQMIQSTIVANYWQMKGSLPATLDDLSDSISGFRAGKDPITGAPYTYRVTGVHAFSLCADFQAIGGDDMGASYPYPVYPGSYGQAKETWDHGAGKACFDRKIDPELYPVNKKAPPEFKDVP